MKTASVRGRFSFELSIPDRQFRDLDSEHCFPSFSTPVASEFEPRLSDCTRYRALARKFQSMNLRHAYAVALVGWYLMVAPPQAFKGHEFSDKDHNLPEVSREWTHKATFDSEFECKQEQLRGCHKFERYGGSVVGLEGPLCFSSCVSSDDPRLKYR
jgi:hypothetical protein